MEIFDLFYLDNVQYRDIVVEIERDTTKKAFLGGYRHKQTGVEYHHATAQTMPRARPQSAVQRFCRDTQTTQHRHIHQQTANDASTQMTQIGTYVSSQQDRLLQPRPYTSADERYQTETNKAIYSSMYSLSAFKTASNLLKCFDLVLFRNWRFGEMYSKCYGDMLFGNEVKVTRYTT